MARGSEHCANCGEATPNAFCPSCGQRKADYRRPLPELASDAFGELFQLDSRIGRTLVPFLFRPGMLTNEFLAGRRARYSSPIRLYLLTSVAYFLALSWIGPANVELRSEPQTGAPAFPSAAERRQAIERESESFERFGSLGVRLRERLLRLSELEEAELTRDLGRALLAQAPTGMFFLLPAFALLLELLFLGSKRLYVEHLIFALHFHSFAFTVQILGLLWTAPGVQAAVTSATLLYLVLALRAVYAQSWPRTLWKTALLVTGYTAILSAVFVAMALLAILAE